MKFAQRPKNHPNIWVETGFRLWIQIKLHLKKRRFCSLPSEETWDPYDKENTATSWIAPVFLLEQEQMKNENQIKKSILVKPQQERELLKGVVMVEMLWKTN